MGSGKKMFKRIICMFLFVGVMILTMGFGTLSASAPIKVLKSETKTVSITKTSISKRIPVVAYHCISNDITGNKE